MTRETSEIADRAVATLVVLTFLGAVGLVSSMTFSWSRPDPASDARRNVLRAWTRGPDATAVADVEYRPLSREVVPRCLLTGPGRAKVSFYAWDPSTGDKERAMRFKVCPVPHGTDASSGLIYTSSPPSLQRFAVGLDREWGSR